MPIDYKEYPIDWKDRIRPDALRKANYKCEYCGVTNHVWGYRDNQKQFIECDEFMLNWAKKQGIKVFQIVLSVMHLNHNVQDNRPENLKVGCQLHHNRHDAEHRRLSRISSKAKKGLLILILFLCSVFSHSQNVNWDKVRNFRCEEFDQKTDPGSCQNMRDEFIWRLDMARSIAGIPFNISSAYRSKEYNKQIGGSGSSAHVLGLAADIWCVDDSDRWTIIRACQAVGIHRFGIYQTHIHVDYDTTKKPSIMWLECR